MDRMQPTFSSGPTLNVACRKSPDHSGGAVPDSHRSSLFAGQEQLLAPGHQSRAGVYRLGNDCQETRLAGGNVTREAVRVVRRCAADLARCGFAACFPQCAGPDGGVKNTSTMLKPLSPSRR